MPAFDVVRRWKGRAVVDRDGVELGAVVELYYDEETDQPGWALVATAAAGTRLVPVIEAVERDGMVEVPLPGSTVADAPGMEPGGRLWPQEVAALYAHYGLAYSGAPTEDAEDVEPVEPRPFEPLKAVGAGPVRRRPL
jgi:PRC-barrel domain